MEPKPVQSRFLKGSKKTSNTKRYFSSFYTDFASFWAPQKMKKNQKPSPETFLKPFNPARPLSDPIWYDFGTILGPFWDHFLSQINQKTNPLQSEIPAPRSSQINVFMLLPGPQCIKKCLARCSFSFTEKRRKSKFRHVRVLSRGSPKRARNHKKSRTGPFIPRIMLVPLACASGLCLLLVPLSCFCLLLRLLRVLLACASCSCLLLVPLPCASSLCLLLAFLASAFCLCLLLLPLSSAACLCTLLAPLASASCFSFLPLVFASCGCPLRVLPRLLIITLHVFL
jgi:hypothetical protein